MEYKQAYPGSCIPSVLLIAHFTTILLFEAISIYFNTQSPLLGLDSFRHTWPRVPSFLVHPSAPLCVIYYLSRYVQ
ncbi:hypothetical protein F5Y04DRAFT_256441 [Hypomontagnella monticulosa]|nr:hypothetical protein F5Y04DRAFT_256441 [Hypomontagnella monticulosa]